MQVFGQISDSLRIRFIKTVTVRKIFCCGGFTIQILFMSLPAFIDDLNNCVAFSILAIGAGGITWPSFNVNTSDISPPHSFMNADIANAFRIPFGNILTDVCLDSYFDSRKSINGNWM